MFTKLKHQIEKWLRGLIADEVSKLNHDLCNERNSLACVGQEVNAAVDRLTELSHFKENAELRSHIRDLESQIVVITDIVKKIHPVT